MKEGGRNKGKKQVYTGRERSSGVGTGRPINSFSREGFALDPGQSIHRETERVRGISVRARHVGKLIFPFQFV